MTKRPPRHAEVSCSSGRVREVWLRLWQNLGTVVYWIIVSYHMLSSPQPERKFALAYDLGRAARAVSLPVSASVGTSFFASAVL